MQDNIKTYKEDLGKLQEKGKSLQNAMMYECYPKEFRSQLGDMAELIISDLPSFKASYQSWYSEALVLIKQLLPDRQADFVRHYEKPKTRKEISVENYHIADYLQDISVTKDTGYGTAETIAGPDAAIPHMQQQNAILEAVSARFESSLFDIKQLIQSDVFDSEISSARELLKKGFLRASGAVSGVVLEKHLAQVANNHNLTIRKKNPAINDFNELLKTASILDTPNWRQIQRMGDIRNLCDHNKEREPTKEEVMELADGVDKFLKTLF